MHIKKTLAILGMMTVTRAFSAVTVTDGIATAAVASGEEYVLTGTDAAAICAAKTFLKTGAGTLVADSANASLASFDGEILIREGVYRISSAADLGTADGGTVVESEACLEARVAETTNLGDEPIRLAGGGPADGSAFGALWVNAAKPVRLNALALTADAAVHVAKNGTLTLNGSVDLASHTLDVCLRDDYALANGSATIRNGGHINVRFLYASKVSTAGMQFGWTYEGNAENRLTGGGTRGGTSCDPAQTPWTWIVDQPLSYRVNAGNRTMTDVPADILSYDSQFWGGPVVLNADVVNGQARTNGEWQVGGFRGPVSGSGNIRMFEPGSAYKTWFKLGSANPDWTGTISAKRDSAEMTYAVNGTTYATRHHTGIAIFADGALTQKTLELKNAELYLGGGDAVQNLPDIETEGHGRIFGSVTGRVARLTKTGTDALSLETKVVVTNELIVQAGTVVLPSIVDAYAAVTSKYTYAALNVAGLSETMYVKGAETTNGPTVRAMGPVAGFFDGNNACVDTDVQKAYKDGPGYDANANWIKDRDADGNLVYQYDGYVWNRSSKGVTWGLMSCINSESQIWLENAAGVLECVQTGGYFASTKAVLDAYAEATLKPGANRIRIRVIGKSGASAGAEVKDASGEAVRVWNKSKPLAYDPELANGLRSGTWSATSSEPFVNLLDKDGKGSLFTTVPEEETELFAKYGTADERAVLAALLPEFAKATFAAGTTLDLNGLPSDVPFALAEMEGSPKVVGGDLTVGNWTLAAEAINAGTATCVAEGRIMFAAGAKLKVRDRGLKATDGGCVLLTAAGGIVGMPTLEFLDRPARAANWELALSSDGKTLRLTGGFTGCLFLVR